MTVILCRKSSLSLDIRFNRRTSPASVIIIYHYDTYKMIWSKIKERKKNEIAQFSCTHNIMRIDFTLIITA